MQNKRSPGLILDVAMNDKKGRAAQWLRLKNRDWQAIDGAMRKVTELLPACHSEKPWEWAPLGKFPKHGPLSLTSLRGATPERLDDRLLTILSHLEFRRLGLR